MRLLSLNAWAGREFDTLMSYIGDYAGNTDIFCFQEVFSTPTKNKIVSERYRANLHQELEVKLQGHLGYHAINEEGRGFGGMHPDFRITSGLSMFVNKEFEILGYGEGFIHGEEVSNRDSDSRELARKLQYITFNKGVQNYTIVNLHGLWNGKGKTDTPDRIEQSKRIKDFLDRYLNEGKERIIVCGILISCQIQKV